MANGAAQVLDMTSGASAPGTEATAAPPGLGSSPVTVKFGGENIANSSTVGRVARDIRVLMARRVAWLRPLAATGGARTNGPCRRTSPMRK